MGDKVSSITVVGGGDAGFLAALALRKVNPDVDIAVVDDFGEPPTEVGQGTFQSIIPLLHDVLGIDEGRFLREVKPVWKASSYFGTGVATNRSTTPSTSGRSNRNWTTRNPPSRCITTTRRGTWSKLAAGWEGATDRAAGSHCSRFLDSSSFSVGCS